MKLLDPRGQPLSDGRAPGLLAGYDNDANRILLPPHVRAMPWEQRVDWARAQGMQPTKEASDLHEEIEKRQRGKTLMSTFLERAEFLVRGAKSKYDPMGLDLAAAYSMFEMLQPWQVTDSVQIAVVNVETVATQDTILTLPANFWTFPGKVVWFHIVGVQSNVITTPGNVTFRLRYNAIGGTILVASGAITPDPVAATNNLWFCDLYVKCLAMGQLVTSLTLLAYGEVTLANAAYTLANSKAQMMPPGQTAVANVANLDGTAPKALTLTAQPTLNTFTVTVRDAWIVAMN